MLVMTYCVIFIILNIICFKIFIWKTNKKLLKTSFVYCTKCHTESQNTLIHWKSHWQIIDKKLCLRWQPSSKFQLVKNLSKKGLSLGQTLWLLFNKYWFVLKVTMIYIQTFQMSCQKRIVTWTNQTK